MGTTPIYTFPSPDLGSTADGPAAIAALAARVEREMPTVRAVNEYQQEPNTFYAEGTVDAIIHSVSVPTSVIGWMSVHAYINIGMQGAVGSDFGTQEVSGFLKLVVDGVVQRTLRWHTLWGTRTLPLTIFGGVGRTAANTTTAIQLKLTVEVGGATGISMNNSNIYAVQIGAPGTG